jgi:hypothetical protein
MSRYVMKLIPTLAAVALGVSSVHAATTLSGVQGEVSIDRGQGFNSVSYATTVKPGDIIKIKEGGTANVVFDNGSMVSVAGGQTYTVPLVAPTALPQSSVTLTQGVDAGAEAAAAGETAGGIGGLSTTTLVVGGVVGVAAVAGIVVAVKNSSASK